MPARDAGHVEREPITIDSAAFEAGFRGFDRPLPVSSRDGTEVALQPWRFGDHFDALRSSLIPGQGTLELDQSAFARQVLYRSEVPMHLHDELAPLALWWAAGGHGSQFSPQGEGERDFDRRGVASTDSWQTIGAVAVRLRRWTEGERQAALARHGETRGDVPWLDIAGYVEAMVRASVVAIAPERELDELDSGVTPGLIDRVVAANVIDPATEPMTSWAASVHNAAAKTLTLCRVLGWTPTQVWATPAAEIDRLLAIIDLVESPPNSPDRAALATTPHAHAPRPHRSAMPASRLAAYSDAVIVDIEDDG
ncbi:MAG: hypothetical protein MJE77_33030 [Proteobacteria bacterium]|nr:hypothetical protein [Pseudomonadota bacterium]